LLRLTERCEQAVQSGRYCVADCSPSGRRRRQTTTLSATTVGRRQKDGDHDGETRTTSADHALSAVRDLGRLRRWSLVGVRTTALDDGRLRRRWVDGSYTATRNPSTFNVQMWTPPLYYGVWLARV